MSLLVALAPLIVLAMIIGLIFFPYSGVKSLADRAVQGKLTDHRDTLQMMLSHVILKPEDWLLDKDRAFYPREGTKQIAINRDKAGQLTYRIDSMDDGEVPLTGYFGHEFDKIMRQEHKEKQERSVARTLFKDDPAFAHLLLTSNVKG